VCERLRGPGPHHGPHTQREPSHSHLARMLARSGHESRVRCVHACQPSVAAYFRFWYMIKSKSSRGSQVYMRGQIRAGAWFLRAGASGRARGRAEPGRAGRESSRPVRGGVAGWLLSCCAVVGCQGSAESARGGAARAPATKRAQYSWCLKNN
jgi:hypothetical protein